jgi:uncharacterized membrane protein YqjE
MTDSTRGDQPSTQELITRMSEQTSRLVRDEVRLGIAELKEKGKHAGIGAGLFSSAGLLGFFALATLIAAAVLALELVVPAWAAALIVAGILLVLAGIAALTGKAEVNRAKPPPERTVENVKRDVDELAGRVNHAE